MFGNNKNIKTANETIASLTAQLGEATKQVEDLKKSTADYPGQLEALKSEYATKIEAMTNEHNIKVAELEKANESIKQSVMKEVSQKITSIGISEEAVKISQDNAGIKSKYIITSVQ